MTTGSAFSPGRSRPAGARLAVVFWCLSVGTSGAARAADGGHPLRPSWPVVADAAPAAASIDAPASVPSWIGEPDQAGSAFGTDLANDGDVNGDGFDDLLIGAAFHGVAGRAFLYLGSSNGPSLAPDWSESSGEVAAHYGESVAFGDVNGDGFDDILVAQTGNIPGASPPGRIFAYYGSPSGPPAAPDWWVTNELHHTHTNFGTGLTAADIDGDGFDDVVVGQRDTAQGGRILYYRGSGGDPSPTPNRIILAPPDSGDFGDALARGNVNGDRYDDVVVGDPLGSTGIRGAAHVFLGGSAGLRSTPDWSASGTSTLSRFGTSVDAVDADGDGYDDVVVGAPEEAFQSAGEAYLYRGGPSGPSALPDWNTVGDIDFSRHGRSVAGVGDVNGDGYDDVGVGAPQRFNGATIGRVAVYYGAAAGLPAVPDWSAESGETDSEFGWALGSGGDADGDGYDDVLVGDRHSDNPERNEGRAFLYAGFCDGPDADGDGRCVGPGIVDCDDTDPTIWGTPGEVRDLRLPDRSTLTWLPPASPGGTAPGYDVLRSENPADFLAALCIESGDASDEQASDADLPGAGVGFHYLVRAGNACPTGGSGPLGKRSDGTPRDGAACP